MRRIGIFLIAGWLISVCIARKLGLREGKSGDEDQKGKPGGEEIVTQPDDINIPNFENPPDEELPPISDQNAPIPNRVSPFADSTLPDQQDPKFNQNENLEDQPLKEKPQDLQSNSKRPLKSGDSFTPYELLPVTRRLIKKVDHPGEGQGIVSSMKNPYALADVLFDAFFLGSKRIVILQNDDIPGLDALQALAQSGDEVQRTAETVTESGYLLKYNDQIIGVKNGPRACKYTLISKRRKNLNSIRRTAKTKHNKSKKPEKSQRRKTALRNRSNKLAAKLGKKRNLIVNAARKNNKNNKTKVIVVHPAADVPPGGARQFPKKIIAKKKLKNKKINKSVFRSPKQRSQMANYASPRPTVARSTLYPNNKKLACRWRYVCTDPGDLDTCRLQTHCTKRKSSETTPNYIGAVEPADRKAVLKRFRRMVGIYPVDEEVEKILEVRITSRRPNRPNEHRERIENLSEYFNKIIMGEIMKTTRAGTQNPLDASTSPVMPDLEKESTTPAGYDEMTTCAPNQESTTSDPTPDDDDVVNRKKTPEEEIVTQQPALKRMLRKANNKRNISAEIY